MTLTIDQLRAHGFSPRVIDLWKGAYAEALLPLQEEAVTRYGFLHGKNLIVFAPTSSGKTFLAELAGVKHLEANRRVIFLVPTKALAEEKYRAFSDVYAPLGLRIVISTRERPESDSLVLDGRYDLLIAVYEKMKSYLVLRPQILQQVGLVIVDEIQMMGDSTRGDILDLLLTKITQSPYQTQFIGLSAALGNPERVASWLGCDLLDFTRRPVELREGVFNLADNYFYYRCFNSGEEDRERLFAREENVGAVRHPPLLRPESDEPFAREPILALAHYLAEQKDEQVLIFAPTRAMTREWARQLSQRVRLSAADAALQALTVYEECRSKDLLAECFQVGIAFHNADLSWDLRQLVEEHYDSGAIRILVSTSTLGQGVNLTGRNVINCLQMVETDPWTGSYTFVPLSRQRFRNQGGRSARYLREEKFGRSILIAHNDAEAERLMHDYVAAELEPITPPMSLKKLDRYVLDLVSSKVATTRRALLEFFLRTYTGSVRTDHDPSRQSLAWSIQMAEGRPVSTRQYSEALSEWINKTVERCVERNLLVQPAPQVGTNIEDEELETTGLGTIAATTGLNPVTVQRLHGWLQSNPAPDSSPLAILLVAAFTPDAREFPIPLSYHERISATYIHQVRALLGFRDSPQTDTTRTEEPPHEETPDSMHPVVGAQNVEPLLSADKSPTGADDYVRQLIEKKGGYRDEDLEALKKALILNNWIQKTDTITIENTYRLFSGTIANLASHFQWLLQSLASMIASLGLSSALRQRVASLAERLIYGVEENGLGLTRLRVEGLSRSYIQALIREGFNTPESLAEAQLPDLERWIPACVAQSLVEEARAVIALDQKTNGFVSEHGARPRGARIEHRSKRKARGVKRLGGTEQVASRRRAIAPAARPIKPEKGKKHREEEPVTLEIDCNAPGAIVLCGKKVQLTPLPYKLLLLLASRPLVGIRYEDLDDSMWEDAKVERQQISAHKSVITKAFARVIGKRHAPQLIKTHAGFGLSLQINPQNIRIIPKRDKSK
jgi:helicase